MQDIYGSIVRRYGQNLTQGGSGNVILDAWKKMLFRFREPDRLRDFQERLSKRVAVLLLLVGSATQ